MQTALKINFQGSESSEGLRQLIEEQVATLERYHGRLTACHVMVKAPGHHHRSGKHFEVDIHLSLPGNLTVDVDHSPRQDGRFDDPRFAVTDAFRRAQRQIEDRIRRQRGDVKNLHERVERALERPES
ncbi:Sigma 54 modulation protein / S30EA ribosomal protein [Enhydrobacter aerosaccus]|uniref:Sigma 54 modulation protein / S30EA ribosomal protein n=1 Tax=Enhydrobacter aerosaccus TaxID=225324 RepID=A0A1T4MXM5_9HYPH|nr:HPF/RaiA family ribosome-associated protein [Enhydrobacter aerosaccus]SJZ71671.1 Sigma 54 modulation protein / S30EA ribosomal protein [Enhydrobacter aerosaccus]